MKRNSVFFESTRQESEAQRFVESLSRARENPWAYCWNCEDIWSSKSLRERPSCTGWKCEYYQVRPARESNCEREDEVLMEEEILTYLFNDPDSITEGLRLGLRSEGFADEYVSAGGIRLPFNRVLWHACHYLTYHDRQIRCSAILSLLSRSPEIRPHINALSRYVQQLRNRAPCQHDTFIKYLSVTNARGARLRGKELVQMAETALASSTIPLEIVLRTLRDQSHTLLFEASDKTSTFKEDLDLFVTNLFAKSEDIIPTPSVWLNTAFGGGWKSGKLYAVTASCDTEATDFIAWCADFAAQRRFPTLYISYGISKEHLAQRALARHSGIDGTEFSRYRQNVFDSATVKTTLERIIEAGEQLSTKMARYLTVVEANTGATIKHVRNALSTAQHQVGLDEDRSMLMILDHFPCPSTYSARPTDSNRTMPIFDERSLLADLKRHLHGVSVAIIVVFAGNKTTNAPSSGNDEEAIKLPLRNLKEEYAADYTLALNSAHSIIKGATSEKTADQLHLAQEWYKRNLPQCRERVERLFDEAAGDYPLDESCTYTRIALFGRDAKVLANPILIHEWPYHRFRTLPIEPVELEKQSSLQFDED